MVLMRSEQSRQSYGKHQYFAEQLHLRIRSCCKVSMSSLRVDDDLLLISLLEQARIWRIWDVERHADGFVESMI